MTTPTPAEESTLSPSLIVAVEALSAIVEDEDRSLDSAVWKLEKIERIVPVIRRGVHAILAEAVC